MGIVLHGETRHGDASALEMAAREQEAAGVARMREAMGAIWASAPGKNADSVTSATRSDHSDTRCEFW